MVGEARRKLLPKRKILSIAEIAAIKRAHAENAAPIAARLRQAKTLERDLSALVNAAYGITPEEEALIWRTAQPGMPIPPPTAPAAQ